MTKAERAALDACYEFRAYAVTCKDAGVEHPDFISKLDTLEYAINKLPERAVRKWMRDNDFHADTPELRMARGER